LFCEKLFVSVDYQFDCNCLDRGLKKKKKKKKKTKPKTQGQKKKKKIEEFQTKTYQQDLKIDL